MPTALKKVEVAKTRVRVFFPFCSSPPSSSLPPLPFLLSKSSELWSRVCSLLLFYFLCLSVSLSLSLSQSQRIDFALRKRRGGGIGEPPFLLLSLSLWSTRGVGKKTTTVVRLTKNRGRQKKAKPFFPSRSPPFFILALSLSLHEMSRVMASFALCVLACLAVVRLFGEKGGKSEELSKTRFLANCQRDRASLAPNSTFS